MTERVPLRLIKHHLFLKLEGNLWLIDTGSGSTAGPGHALMLAGRSVWLARRVLGVELGEIRRAVGVPFMGLIGQNLLSQLDILFDVPGGTALLSSEPLSPADLDLGPSAQVVPMRMGRIWGVPTVDGTVEGQPHRWWIDTGAQVSFFQGPGLRTHESLGEFQDFFPGFGSFTVDTFALPVTLGDTAFPIRAGKLPAPLSAMLTVGRVSGILGQDLFATRRAAFLPLSQQLILGKAA